MTETPSSPEQPPVSWASPPWSPDPSAQPPPPEPPPSSGYPPVPAPPPAPPYQPVGAPYSPAPTYAASAPPYAMTAPTTTPPSRARTATWILAATSIVLFLASIGLGIAYFATVADRDGRIERLRDDIAVQDGTIAEQADTIAAQDDKVVELDDQLQQAQQERDDMRPCFEAARTLADLPGTNRTALERAVDDLLASCGS